MESLPPILFRDRHIVAFNKPSRMLSVPGIGDSKQDALATRAARALPGARIVHRLDYDTSGVIVLALAAEAHRELSRQFHDREVVKEYIAVVAGLLEGESGRIDLPMRKDMDPLRAPRQVIDPVEGREAVTEWWVVKRIPAAPGFPPRTRLRLRPLTGRSHQLRLHLKSIGHPILGDDLYAPEAVQAMGDRLMLHARSLTITHPATRERMNFEAPAPF